MTLRQELSSPRDPLPSSDSLADKFPAWITTELESIRDVSTRKREFLLQRAIQYHRNRFRLVFGAGLCSLLSAALMTTLASNLNTVLIDALAVLFALTGGVLAIAGSFSLNETELRDLHEAASEFQMLRERVRLAQKDDQLDSTERRKLMQEYNEKYTAISDRFDVLMIKAGWTDVKEPAHASSGNENRLQNQPSPE